MKKLVGSLLIASMFLFVACEEENPELEGFKSYTNGVFVINEGGFNKNNGSLSFFSNDSNKMLNYVFMAENNEGVSVDSLKVTIGDIFQSMTIINKEAYLVANNSQKVTVVDLNNLMVSATIENLSYPRFVEKGQGDVAYISNGNGFGGDFVFVLNTITHQITDSIAVGSGPERMLLVGDKLYVTCMGAWSTDSRVFVIDVNTKKVVKVIKTADKPGDILTDKNNDIWVLAGGATLYDANWNPVGSTPAKLSKIDNASMTVTDSVQFDAALASNGSNLLSINKAGDKIFVCNDDLIEIDIEDLSKSTLIAGAGFYGVDVDPKTGYIWGLASPNFGANGKAIVYSESGNKLNEYNVGIAPNSAVFID